MNRFAMILRSPLVALTVFLGGCDRPPVFFSPSELSIVSRGDVERVTVALITAKVQAEDIALACDTLIFNAGAFQHYEASWSRSIAEMAATQPRVLFDGFRLLGYAERFDVFLHRLNNAGAVPDLPGPGEGMTLRNMAGFPAVSVARDPDPDCGDAEEARRRGWLVGAFLAHRPHAPG